jgi:hypothetical protein
VGSRGLSGGCILGVNEDVYDMLEFSGGKYFIGKHSLLLCDGRADFGRSGALQAGETVDRETRHVLQPSSAAYVENFGESQAWKTCTSLGRFS